jgi:hypothetical protein
MKNQILVLKQPNKQRKKFIFRELMQTYDTRQ